MTKKNPTKIIKLNDLVNSEDPEDNQDIITKEKDNQDIITKEKLTSQIEEIISNEPTLTNLDLNETKKLIGEFVASESIPEQLYETLSTYYNKNKDKYNETLTQLIFGMNIGRLIGCEESELTQLGLVLSFSEIGHTQSEIKNIIHKRDHPKISKIILEKAGIEDTSVLEAILKHENPIEKTENMKVKLTIIEKYTQITQMCHQLHELNSNQNTKNSFPLGELYLLGNERNFATKKITYKKYSKKLQKSIIHVIHDSIKTKEKQIEYGNLLYDTLQGICATKYSELNSSELHNFQLDLKKIIYNNNKEDCFNLFNIDKSTLEDDDTRKRFIIGGLRMILQIADSADYFKDTVNKALLLDRTQLDKQYLMQVANPHYKKIKYNKII